MPHKTIKTHDKFHINLSASNIYSNAYKSFLEYEPLDPSDISVPDASATSAVSPPHVVSQVSGSSAAPEIPEIQESTHQVPCGEHSIFDPNNNVPAFERALYTVVNQHSNWDTGITHALSLRRLAELLNVKSHAQVHRGLKWLINEGWLVVEGKRESDGTHFYRVIHHKCAPQDTPVDRDGRPQKCAVPTGEGSASQLLAEGKITWRIFLDWTVRKIHSCWTSGIVSLTVREAAKAMKLGIDTVIENSKKMMEIGLLDRLSPKFRRSEYQMYPKPYPERKERKPEECPTKKAMKLIKGWYYSFNGLWRFSKETFDIQMRDEGRWRYSNHEELYRINKNIHRDFCMYIHHLAKLQENATHA